MNEDTLYPHSDEAGRVPGAVRGLYGPYNRMSDPFAGIPTDYGFEPQRSERNRLVWEAMKVYLARKNMYYDEALGHAINAVDEYLAWRDRDE